MYHEIENKKCEEKKFTQWDIAEIIVGMAIVCLLLICLRAIYLSNEISEVSDWAITIRYIKNGTGHVSNSSDSAMGIKRKNSPNSKIIRCSKSDKIEFTNIKNEEVFEVYYPKENGNCSCWQKIGEIVIK